MWCIYYALITLLHVYNRVQEAVRGLFDCCVPHTRLSNSTWRVMWVNEPAPQKPRQLTLNSLTAAIVEIFTHT